MKSVFCECLWMLGYDWAKTDTASTDAKTQYTALVQHLTRKALIPRKMLLERLEESTLAGCGLISDSNLFMRRRVRFQTKMT